MRGTNMKIPFLVTNAVSDVDINSVTMERFAILLSTSTPYINTNTV